MKLAVIGSGPIALEAALQFHQIGAAVSWFNGVELEPESFFQKDYGDCMSTLGKELLSEMKLKVPTSVDWVTWKESYALPLTAYLASHQEVKEHKIISVTKRYLAPLEVPEGQSRFTDLFRLIYQINPESFINEQKLSNPETFERLTSEFVQSLQSTLEMYEDFDLVMDFRRKTTPQSMAITGRALGEGRISKDKSHYGLAAITQASTYTKDTDQREIALIGSGALAGEVLIHLTEWLKDHRSRLFVVSTEATPFEEYLNRVETNRALSVKSLMDTMEAEFETEVNEFHTKLREWQELDDFVKAKIPKPSEPIPRLVFFSGHNVTAVDQLIDTKRLFLTLEKPSLRPGHKQPDNNVLELKTIGVDEVFVTSPLKKPEINLVLDRNEVGFYSLDPKLPVMKASFAQEMTELKGIMNEIFKLFSPAGNHTVDSH